MDALIGAAGVVAVAAITPGPNNLVVMRAGARGGVRGALPELAGVVLGTLVLLSLLMTGVGVALAADARVGTAITVVGCVYLGWLGARLVAGSFRQHSESDAPAAGSASTGLPGAFVLQFLNPKSWVTLVTTVSAVRTGAEGSAAFVQLAILFAVIPTCCLLLWSSLGSMLTRLLRRNAFRRGFDGAMGGLLIASAVLLLLAS